ncbi:8521_t:CDS:10 [Entrophospora sp. SA101]|nr:8521_t:CDS:10 [Entrophospora sp. SA101]
MSSDDEIVREENDKHYHDKVYHLVLSPNGHHMAIFKSDTLEFKVIETKDAQKLNTIPPHTELLEWSISISNNFRQDNKSKLYLAISCIMFGDMIKHKDKKDGTVKAFKNLQPLKKLKDIMTSNVGSGEDPEIAANNTPSGKSEKNENNKDGDDNKGSLYYTSDRKHKCKTIILTITLEDEGHNDPDNYTINVSSDQTKNFFSLNDKAGILTFLPNGYDIDQRFADSLSIKSPHNSTLTKLLSSSVMTPEISSLLNAHKKTTLVLFNSSGIYRIILNTKENKMDEVQTYQYPHNFEEDLVRYYANKPCIGRLSRCIYENYLLFDQYKDRVQTMEKKSHLIKSYGMSTYAISTNRQLLAYSRGIGKITIYLMENGLEIASKDFGEDQQIILTEFFNDDEQVLVLTQAKNDSRPVINIWNLFYDNFRGLFPSKNIERSHLARNSNVVLRIYGDGSIVNITNHEDFIKACSIDKLDLRKTLEKNKVYTITKKFLQESNWQTPNVNHKLYIPNDSLKSYNNYISGVQLLVDNQEPWIINNQWQRISAFLNKELTLQLLIGSTTNNDDFNKNYKIRHSILVQELYIGEGTFLLDVAWGPKASQKATIRWPYKDHHVTPIIHACKALEHLNGKRDQLVGYEKQHKFEKMLEFITKIIWRFVDNKPEMWKLIDVRYDLMSKLVRGGSNSLIKFILFGKEEIFSKNNYNNNNINGLYGIERRCSHDSKRKLHVPMTEKWKVMSEIFKTYDTNNVSSNYNSVVPIEYSNGGERKKSIMVGYFLDYYGNNALEHLGWMVTASKALPHLYKHNLEHYVEDLFYKECFAEKDLDGNYAIDDLITKEEMLKFRRAEFKAFKGNTKLKQTDMVTKFSLKQFAGDCLIKCFGMITSLTNSTSSSTMPPPIVLRVVPFPNFTLNSLPTQKLQEVIDDVKDFNMPNFLVLLKNIFKHVFVPRGYQVGRKKLDVLSPFAQVIKLDEDIFIFDNPAMEAIIDFSPVFVMSLCLKTTFDFQTGFIGESNDPTLVTWMSFTILFMWCEFVSVEELFIYEFILLQNPTSIGYEPNVNSYVAFDPTTNDTIPNLAFKTGFDPNSTSDNPFSNFFTAIEATYFWINGVWTQRDSWNTWAIKVLSMIASIMLVSVMQNMFIAFMRYVICKIVIISSIFEEAASKGRYACLRFKADMIADYEALEHKKFYFWPAPNEPKYIYYVGHSDNFDEWKERSKDRRGCIFKRYESRNDFLQYKFDDDDLSTDENKNNELIKNLNAKITSFDSEVAALKDLVKTLISELKDAKSNDERKSEFKFAF